MQRYFINDENAIVNLELNMVKMISDDVHHIKNVMRMKKDDQVLLCYKNVTYLASIVSIEEKTVNLEIVKVEDENKELPCLVTIAQGLIRKEKQEEVIDHITEMGASFYLPVVMKKSNLKVDLEKANAKLPRLNKIAKEASEQAHRTKMLEVLPLVSFKDFLKESKKYDLKLVCHVDFSNPLYIADAIKDEKNILVLIGPEAGIDDVELKSLKEHGFLEVHLGRRVLRTEVAPSYVMSIIDYLRGENNEI